MSDLSKPKFVPNFSQLADLGQQARHLADIHGSAPPRQLVSNLVTNVELLHVHHSDSLMPVTVNHGERNNAWICSPLTTYWQYAAEELTRYGRYGGVNWSRPLSTLCNVVGYILKNARIDQAVAVNNWMVSTNIYPDLKTVSLPKIIEQVRERWPMHAIWFRSLNRADNPEWLTALEALGFSLIPSRQVYLYDNLAENMVRHSALKQDMRLLRTTPLRRIGNDAFGEADYSRIAQLYGMLYLDKYSKLNPQYTECFMREWHKAGLLKFDGFRSDTGELQAAVGIFQQGNTLTAPIVGYNTMLPQSLGLYRLLMSSVFDQARGCGGRVNLSAGAAHFKRLRGGVPAIEYSAVLTNHLPAKTRKAIRMLQWTTNSIGVPIMERFKL